MNRKRYKFLVEATILQVQLLVHFQCKIQVIIKKGSQKMETQSNYDLQNGIAIINETLQFNITTDLTQDGKQEEKKAQLIVILVTEKGQKNAGFNNLDFSKYLNQQNLEFQEILELDKCPDKKAKLIVNFKITKIGDLDNDNEVQDQSSDFQQLSANASDQEPFTNKNNQKGTDQMLQIESKSDEFGSKQQKSQNESQQLINKDIKINEQNLLIQNLKVKIDGMIEKDIYQDMLKNYEKQLKDQEDKIKLISDELKAKQLKIQKQNEELQKFKIENQEELSNSNKACSQQLEKQSEQIKLLKVELEQNKVLQEQLKQLNESMVKQIHSYNEKLEILENQMKEKDEQIQNMKNLTIGNISELQQGNEILEKQDSKQICEIEIEEKTDQQPIVATSIDSENIIEELKSAPNLQQQDLEILKQKYESELAQKDQIIHNLQFKLNETLHQEFHLNRLDHESKTQIIQSEKQIHEPIVRPKQEQQINRLKTQIQIWQSKYENNQKVLNEYNNEIQYLLRLVDNVPNFLVDQKELVEPLLLLRRAIQVKLQNYQMTQQLSEQRIQQLHQELEVCQYKLKLEQSQQYSNLQSQPKTQKTYGDEVTKINEFLEQNKEELRILQEQVDQQKLLNVDTSKQLEEAKSQLAIMRTNLSKSKQQLAETMQEKVLLQAKMAEQQKALKEKIQEIQKDQEIISDLEQYNIQMEEALSQTLDQYKQQNTQMKQAYEKEKKLRQELQQQIKSLKEDQTKVLQGESKIKSTEEKIQQCNCKEKIQYYEQKIAELEFQISDLQIQRLDKTIQRNSIAQVRASILVSHRESLAFQQLEEANNQRSELSKIKDIEDQNVNLTDERFKMSKEYQTILERALLANSQIENKYKNQVKELEEKIDQQSQSLIKMKLEIADLYSAAINIGGTILVDKLHIALGVIE
ncbi:unnamed protein product [Paramecium sonneborni]|uniref:C2 NT-type domain-containing protein n=1 Tax=Paramecium sonneborni TaxID=65129 RepID=A0A8S1Q791_9CILI|nr:unnamed protein product [Paramecium sonneborni]